MVSSMEDAGIFLLCVLLRRLLCITYLQSGWPGMPQPVAYAERANQTHSRGCAMDHAIDDRPYARRSLETLLDIARRQPDVQTVGASASPKNTASRELINIHGSSRPASNGMRKTKWNRLVQGS